MAQRGKLGIGLVGYGYWGPNLLRNLMSSPDCRVLGCCDQDPFRLLQVEEKYPDIRTTERYEDLLAMPGLDAVVVATPVFTHYGLAKDALDNGKHVFVEKPMTTSAADAVTLIETAEAKGLVLMVGHTFLYSPPVIKIKELIDSGELGDICYISSSRVNLGIHQPDVSVIWDLAPHDFSIIFHWLGEEPVRVSASGRDFIRAGFHDVAFIDLEFPSGVVAHVQDSWLSPSRRRQMTIVGSKKMIIYDDTNLEEQVRIFDKGVAFIEDPESFGNHQLTYRIGDIMTPRLEAKEPLSVEMGHFADSIIKGSRPKTDGHQGLAIVRVLEAADRSIKDSGGMQAVRPLVLNGPMEIVDEPMGTDLTLSPDDSLEALGE